MPALYKITGPAGECLNGGNGRWPLPQGDTPGDWWRVEGEIVPCRNGLHVTDAEHLLEWLPRDGRAVVWPVETDGEVIPAGNKYAARAVRLLPRSEGVDINAAIEARDAAITEASRRRNAAIGAAHAAFDAAAKRAERKRAADVPDGWRKYLQAVGKLPQGHPGAVYAERLAAANAAYDRAMTRPAKALGRAKAAAEAAYLVEIAPVEAAFRVAILPSAEPMD